jgi:hypothetical protein
MKKFNVLLLLVFLSGCSLSPVNTSLIQTYNLHASNTFGQPQHKEMLVCF